MFVRASALLLSSLLVAACGENSSEPPIKPDTAKSVEAFKNRKTYDRLSPEILAKIPDDELEEAIVGYVETKVGRRYEQERQIVTTLSRGIQALFITWWVEAEVNNGGFNQYYWNNAGQFADSAPGAFDYFGARRHADLMRQANEIRRTEAAAMQKYKDRGSLEAFSASYKESKLGPLDKQFYELKENLRALRIARIRAHPEDFSGN